MYLVQLGAEVGAGPSGIISPCRGCANLLFGWLSLNAIAARRLSIEEPFVPVSSLDKEELAQVVVDSFEAWHRWAVGGPNPAEHLSVLGRVR